MITNLKARPAPLDREKIGMALAKDNDHREPPFSLETEQAVLGGVMINNDWLDRFPLSIFMNKSMAKFTPR